MTACEGFHRLFRILKRNVISQGCANLFACLSSLLARAARIAPAPAAAPLRRRSMQSASSTPATLVESRPDQPWRLHVGLTVKLDVLVMITVVAFVSAIVLGAF